MNLNCFKKTPKYGGSVEICNWQILEWSPVAKKYLDIHGPWTLVSTDHLGIHGPWKKPGGYTLTVK